MATTKYYYRPHENLNVIEIISEPTAAALYYGCAKEQEEKLLAQKKNKNNKMSAWQGNKR